MPNTTFQAELQFNMVKGRHKGGADWLVSRFPRIKCDPIPDWAKPIMMMQGRGKRKGKGWLVNWVKRGGDWYAPRSSR